MVAVAAIASCGPSSTAPAKLAAVAPLPRPSLPAWIASISPTGNAQSLAQIRVIFDKPVTKVEALSGAGPADVLGHLSIEPALKGHFTVLTPRMIGFVAEQAIPIGTRVAVRLSAGLHDLDGDRLDHDLAWTFETDPLKLSDLPQWQAKDDQTPQPVGLHPTLKMTANAAVDVASLTAHTTLSANGQSVPVTIALEARPTPYPGSTAAELFDPSIRDWVYDVVPQRDLQRSATYALTVAPGVDPAYGNLATKKSFSGSVHTYDPLAIVPTPSAAPDSGGSRFTNGDPAIVFNNPLDPKSIAGAVTISPAPASVKTLVSLSDSGNVIAIDPYALDPDATYAVTVAGTVKDAFGQTLGASRSLTIRTSDFTPGVWAPTGTSVIPAGAAIDLDFYATNLPQAAYRAAFARVEPQGMLGNADPLASLPLPRNWPRHTIAGARRNVQSVVPIALQAQLGGPYGSLAYGFRTALDATDSAPSLVGIAQLTNLGVFAQWFPGRAIVLVQHLSDGTPAAGADVTAYRIDRETNAVLGQCASGRTNSDGEADFEGIDIERCYAGVPANQAPAMGVVVSQGGDVATLTIGSYSGIYRFDVNGGWSSGAPLSRGIVFTDRQMYQPGERGEMTGIAYYVSGTSVVADRNAAYRVTLQDPSNNSVALGTATTDAYGVFSMPIVFSKQQALGYYTIDAKGASGNDITGSLRVAQFKPPNFKLTLALNATSAAAGSSVKATAAAAYLFGAPLQGGSAHAYVTRDIAYPQPNGWDDFSFGPQWFWPEQQPWL